MAEMSRRSTYHDTEHMFYCQAVNPSTQYMASLVLQCSVCSVQYSVFGVQCSVFSMQYAVRSEQGGKKGSAGRLRMLRKGNGGRELTHDCRAEGYARQ